MKDFYDIIKSRRSIRGYKSDEVPADKLSRILDAGTYAPTGRGKQSPQIIAIKDKMTRDRLSALNAAVLGTDSDPYYGAPVIVLVLADGNVNTFVEDGSCVLENLMLAAEAEGLGSVWETRPRGIPLDSDVETILPVNNL